MPTGHLSFRVHALHTTQGCQLDGLGAVLNQEYPEGLRPVAFASWKLRNSERNYPVYQPEFFALKWAVVDKFHNYLYGAKFTVRTDNNLLTYVMLSRLLNSMPLAIGGWQPYPLMILAYCTDQEEKMSMQTCCPGMEVQQTRRGYLHQW